MGSLFGKDGFLYREAIGYQIYPMSFMDSNNDGIGDIQGMISKLDYLSDLGINLVWICPVYSSPMYDNGYDISDYADINPVFGCMDDMQEFIDKAGSRNIGVMLDLVVNHTSDEHPWFKEALNNSDSQYRDYYYFEKGDAKGNPPSNWRSVFGGCVWEPVPGEDNTYYFHSFSKKQPDLNWNNPDMRREINDMIHDWMARGIVGFRVDAINFIRKSEFKNYPADGPDGLVSCFKYTRNVAGIEEQYGYLRDIFRRNKCITVSEAVGVPYGELEDYIGNNGTFSMMFDFNYMNVDIENEQYFRKREWSIKELRDLIYESQESIQKTGWCAPFLENHDLPRSVSRYIKNNEYYKEGAKALAMMNLLLRGTPFIYQGEELGLVNFRRTDIDEFDDVNTKDQYNQALACGFDAKKAIEYMNDRSRDNTRTPFSWNKDRYGGFSKVRPWIKPGYEYPVLNAEDELADAGSVLNFYKKIIAVRKSDRVFIDGIFEALPFNDNVVSYIRKNDSAAYAVLVNLSDETIPVELDYERIVCNTHGSYEDKLRPYQAVTMLLNYF